MGVQNFFENGDLHTTRSFCLVTGASSGIGKAIALELAHLKKNLVLVALPDTGLEELGEQIAHSHKVAVLTIATDLTQISNHHQILKTCEANNIQVNVLINNAGFGNLESFQQTSWSELESMMALNNTALVSLTYIFIPHLKKSAPAYILNTGSLASFFRIPFKAVYSATKSFVYSFSASLRLELLRDNIHVACLCPGGTLTSQRFRDILKKSNGRGERFLQLPDAVAHTAIEGLFRKKFRIIPGFHNRMMLLLYGLLPEKIINWALVRHFSPK